MTVAIRSVFHEGSKYCSPFLLDQCLYKSKMLEHDRIDMLERTDVNKTNGLPECIICYYCYFLNINFRFQPEICNGCNHKCKNLSFNDVAIASVKGN